MNSRRGRLFILSELYRPETTSTGAFLTGIAEGLAEPAVPVSWEVKVLCAQPSYRERGVTAPWREELNGVQVRRIRAFRFHRSSILLRLLNAISFSVGVFWRGLLEFRSGDVVVAVTNPPTLPFVSWAAARVRGARFVLLIHDVYPEVLLATGHLSPGGGRARILSAFTRRLYGAAWRIVVLGRDMAELVKAKAPVAANRVRLIPNWGEVVEAEVPPALVAPTGPAAAPTPAPAPATAPRLRLVYSGNLGRTHGLENLVEAAARLEPQQVEFMVAGDGVRATWLAHEVRRRGLAHVRLLGYQPTPDLKALLASAHATLLTFQPGMAGVSVPSRMYNLLGAGRPLLAVCDPHSEVALLLKENRCGWVVPPGDPDALVEAVRRVAATPPHELEAMGRRGRQAVAESYTREAVVEAWRGLLRESGRS
ncbi:MAG: glycosyltransferase family 4 protein [Gemmatimonadota bacterium]